MELVLPTETDYPDEVFRSDLPPEQRVGCAWVYFRSNRIVRHLFRKRVKIAFELLPQRRWARALDAGTGAGFLLPMLAKVANEVVGVDLSPVMRYSQVMLDRRGLRSVQLQQADLLHLPFPDGHFDLILCMSVIEHMPDPAVACAEWGRVLQPGGVLILGYPMEHALLRFLVKTARIERRLRDFVRRRAQSRGTPPHQHVSDWRRIDGSWESVFELTARRNLRLLGIPLYRILRLNRKG
jgi:SAM-dependent methyltransferase